MKMPNYTLGLDLGSNSIGWAMIADEPVARKQNIHVGVRVFPAGTDNEGETETPRNQDRREARLRRRQSERRAQRKRKLLYIFQKHDIYPLIHQRHRKTGKDHALPYPYTLRAKALDHALSLPELGRLPCGSDHALLPWGSLFGQMLRSCLGQKYSGTR